MRAQGPSRRDMLDATAWLLVVTAGLLVTGLAVWLGADVGVPGAPFTGEYRLKVEIGTVLAPAVAMVVVAAARSTILSRTRWPLLLLLSYAAAVAWAVTLALVDGGNGLAAPVARPEEYLSDVDAVGQDPGGFIDTFVDSVDGYSVATRTHPPGPVLLLWALTRAGVTRPLVIGVLITMIGCITVPAVGVAMRSLCGELAARRLLPVLVLAPYAVWVAVSMDGVTTALCAVAVACGVVATERGRSPWWALLGGALLGVGALFSYAAGWLGTILLVVCFVRRRGRIIALLGVGALIPLMTFRTLGFVWPDGLTAAQADWSERIGPNRSWLVWIVLDVVMLVIACGPLILPAARKIRRTPGWPLMLGAGVAVLFALSSGLSRGEAERSWLPFFPWLLVAAVAPEPEQPADASAAPSRVLLVMGAAAAVVIESVLRSAW